MSEGRPSPAELRALHAAGMSVKQIAETLNRSQAVVLRWMSETGKPKPPKGRGRSDWRQRLNHLRDVAIERIVQVVEREDMHEPRDAIAQARLATDLLRLTHDLAPPEQKSVESREDLLAKAKKASASAERLRIVS